MKTLVEKLMVVLVVLGMAGCTTMKPLRDTAPDAIVHSIRVGDEVVVKTRTSQLFAFKVESVDRGRMTGAGVEIPLGDIQSIQVKGFSAGRTAGLAAGVLVPVYLLAALLLISTY